MRSEKQRAASRLNGAKSRGPVTSAGKRIVSQNATKHGAYAKAILLPTESAADFDLLVDITVQEFEPATPFEAMLVEDMITARWRAKRFAIMEQALIKQRLKLLEEKAAETAEAGSDAMADLNAADITALACQELVDTSQALQFLHRSAARFSREFLRCHSRLLAVQDRRRDNQPPTEPGPNVVSPNVVSIDKAQPDTGRGGSQMSASQVSENEEQTQQPTEYTEPAAVGFLGIFGERTFARPTETAPVKTNDDIRTMAAHAGTAPDDPYRGPSPSAVRDDSAQHVANRSQEQPATLPLRELEARPHQPRPNNP